MSTALWPAFPPGQPYNPSQRSGLARKRLNLAPPLLPIHLTVAMDLTIFRVGLVGPETPRESAY